MYSGDFDRLAELHPDLGPSVALREILRAHIQAVDEQVARTAPTVKVDPTQLGLFDK